MIEFIIYIVLLLVVGAFLLYRIEWVYQQRIKLLGEDRVKHKKLPTYDYMVGHFWVWDVNKFIRQDPE